MAVSDRIAVMNAGVIQHLGTPKSIYQRPANLFVATFIGRSNILPGKLTAGPEGCGLTLPGNYRVRMDHVRPRYAASQSVQVSVRPEELLVHADSSRGGMKAVIRDSVFLGLNTHYFLELEDGQQVEAVQESTIESILTKGSTVYLTVKTEKINIFLEDGSANLLEGVRNEAEVTL